VQQRGVLGTKEILEALVDGIGGASSRIYLLDLACNRHSGCKTWNASALKRRSSLDFVM